MLSTRARLPWVAALISAATQHRDEVVSPITATHLGRYLELLTDIATGPTPPPAPVNCSW